VYFAPLLKGFPLELGNGTGGQKTRVMGLSGEKKKFDDLAVWIQSTNVTDSDRRTDGHRATAKTSLTHSVDRVAR